MRGGILTGLTDGNNEVPIGVTEDRELKTEDHGDLSIEERSYLELKAIRIGLGLLLRKDPDFLMKLATK
jgi:hypothetical protein